MFHHGEDLHLLQILRNTAKLVITQEKNVSSSFSKDRLREKTSLHIEMG